MNKISDRRIDDIAQEMQQTTIAMAARGGRVGDDENYGEEEGCRRARRASRRVVGWDNESKAVPVCVSVPLAPLSRLPSPES